MPWPPVSIGRCHRVWSRFNHLNFTLTLSWTTTRFYHAADACELKDLLKGVGVDSFEKSADEGGVGSGAAETIDFLVDPGMYREVEEAVRTFGGYLLL